MRITGVTPNYLTRLESPQATLAANTDSKEVQETLSHHSNITVRATLAEFNRSLDIDVVQTLAEDKSPRVRNALARNVNLSEEAQVYIAEQRR